jgi:hypothetical protein
MAMPHSRQAKSSSNAIDAFQAIMPGACQTVAVAATADESAAFTDRTTIVRIVCTVDCFVNFGTAPVPTGGTDALYLPANTVEYFGVDPSTKLGVIRAGSDDGDIYITEGA